MSTVTIDLTEALAKAKAQLPEALQPAFENAMSVLQSWGQDELNAWLRLAQSDEDAARTKLLGAMDESALTAQAEADGAQFDQDVATNAEHVADQTALLKQVWQAILGIAGGLLSVAL